MLSKKQKKLPPKPRSLNKQPSKQVIQMRRNSGKKQRSTSTRLQNVTKNERRTSSKALIRRKQSLGSLGRPLQTASPTHEKIWIKHLSTTLNSNQSLEKCSTKLKRRKLPVT